LKKKTVEDYVELIYLLEQDKTPVHTMDVATSLGISPASVTEIFQKLSDEGYINYQKYAGVSLTSKGKKIALSTIKKHGVLRDFLMILGVDDEVANKDACMMEHVLHKETMARLMKFVNFVKLAKGDPRWLDHFKHYYETGQYVGCDSTHIHDCPLHVSSQSTKK